MTLAPYTPDLVPAVRAFNRRMQPAAVTPFPEWPVSDWLPKTPGRAIHEEMFVALDGAEVRGGYILKRQPVHFGGEGVEAAGLRAPVSEGVLDGAYRMVGIQAVRDALRRQPLLFGMGMGGEKEPVARLLKAMGWSIEPVPFYLKVTDGFRFLRQAAALRHTAWRRGLADLAAFSGAGWLGARLLNAARTRNRGLARRLEIGRMNRFEPWCDELWNACRRRYSLISARDTQTLNALYSPADPKFLRLRVSEAGRPVGWAVVVDRQLHGHDRFGNLRAGLIMDALALPEDAEKVIGGAVTVLEQRGVDVLRSHQSHPAWGAALARCGFLNGPSYFLFGAAPAFADKLNRVDPQRRGVFLNRGDGDGQLYL